MAAGVAHTLGHLYGAPDGPSGDIMDKDHFIQSYRDGLVAESTWDAIHAIRKDIRHATLTP
jgi:hypothetical protein